MEIKWKKEAYKSGEKRESLLATVVYGEKQPNIPREPVRKTQSKDIKALKTQIEGFYYHCDNSNRKQEWNRGTREAPPPSSLHFKDRW